MIIDRLLPLPSAPTSGDELAIERGVNAYKIDYDALAAAIIAQYTKNNLTTTTPGYVLDARQGKTLNDAIAATQSDIAIIIDGNKTTHTGGAAVGQYVIVRNSTISGITDGLYKATQAIPVNTAITSAYLSAVSGGGLNELNSKIAKLHIATVTGTMGSDTNTNYSFDAPSGYDAENSAIIGYSNKNSSNNGWYGNNGEASCWMNSNTVYMRTSASVFTNTPFKILLMKYENA